MAATEARTFQPPQVLKIIPLFICFSMHILKIIFGSKLWKQIGSVLLTGDGENSESEASWSRGI